MQKFAITKNFNKSIIAISFPDPAYSVQDQEGALDGPLTCAEKTDLPYVKIRDHKNFQLMDYGVSIRVVN